jgi:MYXO-CTERM domain-containing protein
MYLKRLAFFLTAALLAAPPAARAALPTVLVLAASSSTGGDVQAKIMGTGAFSKVDLINVSNLNSTPTVQAMKAYDAVAIYSYIDFDNPVAIGNNLADYLDQGGGVVVFDYETYEDAYQIQGRWVTDYALMAIQPSLNIPTKGFGLGKIDEMGSPLLDNVVKFGCGIAGCHHLSSVVQHGGIVVAEHLDGTPLVLRGAFAGHRVVELNFFPASNSLGNGEWDRTTDGATLMKNALLYVTGGSVKADKGQIAFADTQVGDITAPQTITYTNTGMLAATLSDVSLGGANATDFILTPSAQLPQTLQPNATFKVDVAFAPGAMAGARTAYVRATVMGQMNFVDTFLSGKAIGGDLAILPNPVRMGGVKTGGQLTKTLTITNVTNLNVTINTMSISANSTEFAVTPSMQLPITLVPNSGLTADITFTSMTPGNRTGNLLITKQGLANQNVALYASDGDPKVVLSNGSLILGNQHVGVAGPALPLTVTNAGFSDLTVSAIAASGPNAADFTITAPNPPVVLGPGQILNYSTTFKPSALGPRSATITVASDDPNTPSAPFSVSGTGVAFMESVAPTTLDFGVVKGGQSSMPMTTTLTNASAAPLGVTSLVLAGPDAAYFSAKLPNAPLQVSANGTLPLAIVYAPLAPGMHTATLTIGLDDPNLPTVTVTLKGSCVVGKLVIAPLTLDFGDVPLGMTTPPKTLTLTNSGSAPLVISGIGLSGNAKFSYTTSAIMTPSTIAPGAKISLTVTYTPGAHALETAEIDIASDDPMLPLARVPLRGVGTQADIAVDPLTLAFGPIPVSIASAPQSVTVHNTGDAPLSISSIHLTGMNPGEFTANPASLTLAPGDTGDVAVIFAPKSAISAMATLTITPDDINIAPVEVALTGTGVSSMVTVTPSVINFGLVGIGTTSPATTVTVTNTGKAPLPIATIKSTSPVFTVDTTGANLMLPPDGSTTFTVTFTPVQAMAVNAQVLIVLQGGTKAVGTVNLMGEGLSTEMMGGPRPGGCACATGRAAPPAGPFAALALLALAALRRRRY